MKGGGCRRKTGAPVEPRKAESQLPETTPYSQKEEMMLRNRLYAGCILLVVGCALVSPSGRAGERTEPGPGSAADGVGVLLIAHGAEPAWNREIKAVAEQVDALFPTEVLFLMGADHENARHVYERLARRGISSLVIVPLFVSSYSDHFEQIRFIAGLRKDYPHAEHMKLEQIDATVPVVLSPALNDSPVLSAILLRRARVLSTSSAEEVVLLVAHGPNSDDDAERWIEHLARVAERLKIGGGFREVAVRLIRDDAPAEVRATAVEQIRAFVRESSRESRVLVVPVLVAPGKVSREKVPEILEGLDCRYSGETLLPDPDIPGWVVEVVRNQKDRVLAVEQTELPEPGGR